VLLRPSEAEDMHVGSVKFMAGGKRGAALRIPSFGMGREDIKERGDKASDEENTSSDDELMEAIMGLNGAHPGISDFRNATANSGSSCHFILLASICLFNSNSSP
jgi:LIM domain kinase 1